MEGVKLRSFGRRIGVVPQIQIGRVASVRLTSDEALGGPAVQSVPRGGQNALGIAGSGV